MRFRAFLIVGKLIPDACYLQKMHLTSLAIVNENKPGYNCLNL